MRPLKLKLTVSLLLMGGVAWAAPTPPMAGTATPPAIAAQTTPKIIYLQPLGQALPEASVRLVMDALTLFYGMEVRQLPRVEPPRETRYAPTGRYRAELLLPFLAARLPADGFRILGLTDLDISTTKGKVYDWGILGLATLDGRACIISSLRCRRTAKHALHGRIRLAKVAVHEIGHTLGLAHCPTRGCLMEDAQGTVKTTDREYDLCPICRQRLREAGHVIPEQPPIPWPRP